MKKVKEGAGPLEQSWGIPDAELAEAERLGREATPGPWGHASYTMWYGQVLHRLLDAEGKPLVRGGRSYAVVREEDALFIAHARRCLPRLVEEVRRLRGLLTRHGIPTGAKPRQPPKASPAKPPPRRRRRRTEPRAEQDSGSG